MYIKAFTTEIPGKEKTHCLMTFQSFEDDHTFIEEHSKEVDLPKDYHTKRMAYASLSRDAFLVEMPCLKPDDLQE